MSNVPVVYSEERLDIEDSIYEHEESNEKIPEKGKKRSLGREKVDVPIESNIDKVLEHLNKKQKIPLDAVEMLMLSHAKTIKTFSPKRQAIAKKNITEIVTNLELEQIEENEYRQYYQSSSQTYQPTDDVQSYRPTDDVQTYQPTGDVINLSTADRASNYYNIHQL